MRSILLLLLAAPLIGHAQLLSQAALDSVRTFRGIESAMKDPLKVFRLDLSRGKLKAVPEEIRAMKNLNALDLSRNKLRTLPAWIGELGYMQELRVSRNKLMAFPDVICSFVHLKRLDLSRNALPGLPACMGALAELVSLDLWSNDLVDFPPELEGMKALRFLDLRAIEFSQEEMQHIHDVLPWATIYFSQPCDCGM